MSQAQLKVTGVSDELLTNLHAHLPLMDTACDAEGWYIQEQRKRIPKAIKNALEPYGFYAPTFQAAFNRDDDCWHIKLAITPGPQVQWRTVDISTTAADLPEGLSRLIRDYPFRTGDAIRHSDYDRYKQRLMDTARELGYWDAEFTRAELAIYPKQLAADVILTLNPGVRYRFGEFHFSPSRLSPEFMQRLAGKNDSEWYISESLETLYQRLQTSDYFRQVLITPDFANSDDEHHVPMDIDVTMQSRSSISTGVGYSTDQGPRVKLAYRNRYVNEEGHKFRSEALWSNPTQEVTGIYSIPLANPIKEWLEIDGGYRREDTDNYENKTWSSGVRIIQELPSRWLLTYGVNYSYEDYIIANEEPDTSQLITPEIGVSWVSSSVVTRQQEGFRVEARVLASHEAWLSDTNFIQGHLSSKWITSFNDKNRLLSRIQLAGTLKDDFTDLPPSIRLYTGGDNSVRGYGYDKISPVDSEGELIGGSHLIAGSIEYDYLFAPKWSVAVFTDAGDAFDTHPDFKRSVGLGLRWYSPLGPIRMDIAHPLDDDNDFRLHLTVGTDI